MRNALVLSSLIFVIHSANAQKTEVELLIGTNLSTLKPNVSNNSEYFPKFGFTEGIGLNTYLHPGVSLGFRLLYQRQIVRGMFPFQGPGYVGDVRLTTSFDKLTLPVVGRYTFGEKIKFTGEFGWFLSYQYSASVKDPDYVDVNPYYYEFAEQTKKYTLFDAGITLGVSAQIPIDERLSFKLLVFNNFGQVNISKIKYGQYQSFETNSVNILAGFTYKIK